MFNLLSVSETTAAVKRAAGIETEGEGTQEQGASGGPKQSQDEDEIQGPIEQPIPPSKTPAAKKQKKVTVPKRADEEDRDSLYVASTGGG
ncbi:hypothetical protein PTTG_29322 [Puccinia triticina 1-1 BBBD Race 1]|uniref:Uncharacterized protein n=1 Tax=Puccinia triticina (isolate 1-1 / race 1 (BBBD)) TaxID=630390 RepID=A0A180G728_PUCT1|nr:hypothetical protein PTTG_29322 [Puccinia triticina 1-1 BBBD Race 1]